MSNSKSSATGKSNTDDNGRTFQQFYLPAVDERIVSNETWRVWAVSNWFKLVFAAAFFEQVMNLGVFEIWQFLIDGVTATLELCSFVCSPVSFLRSSMWTVNALHYFVP